MPKILTSKGLSYEILFPIKETPEKQVYKALRKEPVTGIEQVVLLKIFSAGEESFKGELESLLQARSNHCIRLLAFENFSKRKALVLEYIQGISLAQLLKTFTLSESEIHHLLTSIYKGLEDLKKQGLSHGDLSLDNVLLDKEAQIKFIDFGKGNYNESSLGTFPFIAPEILKGGRSNFLSDLFSLGVLEVFLKNPYEISKLKQKTPEEFISPTNPLLASDPQDRAFLINKSRFEKKATLRSLSYKVRDFLSSTESKKYKTQKIFKPSSFFLSFKHLARQVSILLFFGIFAGASNFSGLEKPVGGFLKVSTNQWVFVQLQDFSSYAPMKLSLPSGWHSLKWETSTKKGTKLIYIKPKQTLLLNDKDLLEKTNE